MSASALYEGWVGHRRMDPVEHSFRYPIFMAYLDLDELPEVLDPFLGWSARRPAPARFRRSDYLGDPARPLAACVREAVTERGCPQPGGPIRLLTNLRYLGHCFNPVSFYFCFEPDGERVQSVLAEVTNTPWGERHAYVIGSEDAEGVNGERVLRGRLEKAFHVSPLMDMNHVYDWRTGTPGEGLGVQISSSSGGRVSFDATLALRRRELSPASTRRVLTRYPAMTAQVAAKIYWQSLRLKLKGAPYFPHPGGGGAARP